MIAALRARSFLASFIKDIAAVTLMRRSTFAVTVTWAIKFYGAVNLLLQ
jgi:hypothetical protein